MTSLQFFISSILHDIKILFLYSSLGGFLEEFVTKYGYFAVFVLTFFEGESVLFAAGFLAYSGYLSAITIVIISAIASYIGHGFFFLVALYKRETFLRYIQKVIKVNLSRLESLMDRYGIASIFISQWLYGFRLLSAAVLGLSRMGKRKYFSFLLMSCFIWAAICTYCGYFFGATIKQILGNVKKYELPIAAGFIVVGFILWVIRDVRKMRNSNQEQKPP